MGVRSTSDASVIEGNYIGTNAAANAAISNSWGVYVTGGSNARIGGTTSGERNVISGSTTAGIFLSAQADAVVVEGNYIGTDASGATAVPNQRGVLMHNTRGNQVIGGTVAGARNIISGNDACGVCLEPEIVAGDLIEGNYIGTDTSGTLAVPNNEGVFEASTGATIRGNLVSGNITTGVDINDSDVFGNLIGTQADGISALGNGGDGVRKQFDYPRAVGGLAPGDGNVIAFNGGAGVRVTAGPNAGPGKKLSIRGNSIYSNAALGIDLDPPTGVTANDGLDTDTGPNDLQNFPSISATTAAGSTTVNGTLNSVANTMFDIDIYYNASCDPSGYGQGKTYAGSTTVTTDGAGNGGFAKGLPGSAAYVTATATDSAGDTSEFSQCAAPVSANDTDGDGCPDVRELGASHTTGGQRNPNDFWDFFDVPTPPLLPSNPSGVRNHAISIADAIAVLAFIGTSSGNPNTPNSRDATYGSDLNSNGMQDGQEYDRTAGAQAWAPGPPNGAVSIADALLAENSIGDNCN
jgi:titin